MSPIRSGTPSGDADLALQKAARNTGRPTQELFQLYVLEGFLTRLSVSDAGIRLVLKGGVLLAAFDARRPTKDVDLAGINVANDANDVLELLRGVLDTAPPSPDGINFMAETATAETIREDDDYSGVRVRAQARLSRAKIAFHVDVNVGDPIWPAPTTVAVPRLLGGEPIDLVGYPMHMVHAEKIVTAAQRGTANTRWRDFGDIWTLARQHPIDASDLAEAIDHVARHRGTTLRPLAEVLDGFANLAQSRWASWRRRSNSDHLPEQFAAVLADVTGFADPVIDRTATGTSWDPKATRWQ